MIFFVMSVVFVVLDLMMVYGIRKAFPQFSQRHKSGIRTVCIVQLATVLLIVLGGYFLQNRVRDYRMLTLYYYLFGFILTVYSPKALFILFTGIDIHLRKKGRNTRHVPAKVGIAVSLLLPCIIVWGMVSCRYHYTVVPVEVELAALPPAFDGYRVVQLSDLHAGSFAGFTDRFREAAEIINGQNPDLIVFTGDMVNNYAEEAEPFIPIFSRLKARDGKYAVLGNHDYGLYYQWPEPAGRDANMAKTEQAIARMGFELLKNRAVVIRKDSLSQLALVGVENWGLSKRRPRKGDIAVATNQVSDIPIKILLSHDPSFWAEKIAARTDVALTLSGHTHGTQMGIRVGRRYFSPAGFLYRHWAGLYREGDQYLYVNRGLGVIGYPGRIGMPPEITVITLRAKRQAAPDQKPAR